MDHFSYRDGVLHAEELSLETVAAEVGTPVYVYSAATLRRHYQVFDTALQTFDRLICFAVKANPNPAVLRVLGDQGAGADVVSEGEIRLALAGGIAPEKIVFSGVAKTRTEMQFALATGIYQFNCESAAELRQLDEVAGAMGKTAPVAVRVNPDVDPQTHAKISTGRKENKFGVAMEQVRELYHEIASLPHLRIQGVSMHIGSQLTSLEPFRQAFRAMRALVDQLRADGHAIATLDLGGGLGVPYGDGVVPPTPEEYAAVVREELDGFDGRLLFEPGRMIAGNAGVLVAQVIYIKDTGTRKFLIVDAGMNDLMRPAMYDAFHEIVAVRPGQGGERYDIVGPVCESSDVFGRDRQLPEMAAGDLIAFRTAGAYGASMSNGYNTRPLVPEVLVDGTKLRMIRRRPDYAELMSVYR